MSEKKYHILIVEDHRELARVLRAGIAALGEEFVAWDVPSGEEALLELRYRKVDVAIIDLRLPGMDGTTTALRMRERQPEIKIFLISGQEEEQIRQAAEKVAADAWFRKPLELADLLDAIERKLGLVQSILGEAPTYLTASEEEKAVGRMSDILADLREALDAQSVAMLNEVGKVGLQAGSVDAAIGHEIRPPLMSLYNTAFEIAHRAHMQQPHAHFYIAGENLGLYLISMTPQYALLVVCNHNCRVASHDEMAKHIRKAVSGLLHIMERLGVVSTEAPTPQDANLDDTDSISEPEATPDLALASDDLLSLLDEGLPLEEADSFWEQLAAEKLPEHTYAPDALTYEQAQRLGLTPPQLGED